MDAFDDEIAHSQERSMQAIHSRIARIEEKRYWKKFIPRVLVTAAALTVMFLVTNLILSSQGIRMFQGKDQEQYVVQGQDRDDPMRVWAGGAEDGETQMVTFANIEEVQNAFVPRLWVPTWLPEGMELSVARGVRNPVFTEITLPYADTLSREVIVNATRYQNARQAGSTYEQNEEGHTIILTNGTKAYIATNMDVDWAFVTMQDTLYQVVCIGFDEPTLIRILNSIAERDSS